MSCTMFIIINMQVKKKSYFLTQDNDTSGNTGYTGAGTPYVSDSCLFK